MEVLEGSDEPLAADLATFWKLRTFSEVDSTNTRIKEAIVQGAPEGTCFAAQRQTAGYGRQGRSWSSPEGGLYFSFILDPLDAHPEAGKTLADLPAVSLVMSLSIQAGLVAFTRNDAIKIKWPNDIVVGEGANYAKLCGISLEMVGRKLCCGVGVNVSRPSADAEAQQEAPSAAYGVAYLQELRCDPRTDERVEASPFVRLLSLVLRSVMQVYQRWLQDGIESLITRYNDLLFNVGSEVVLEAIDGKTLYEGEVLGVDATGELLLKTPTSNIVRAASGEVHTRIARI